MGLDKTQIQRTAAKATERRNRRKLAESTRWFRGGAQPRSLILTGAPSSRWRSHWFNIAFAETRRPPYVMAGRSDFIRLVNHKDLTATIAVGLEAGICPLETYFAVVRKARLYGGADPDLLEAFSWSKNAHLDLRNNNETEIPELIWTLEDIGLIRATAAYLISHQEPLATRYIKDLHRLSSSADAYIRGEAKLLLAQVHLETAIGLRTPQAPNFLTRLNTVSLAILQRTSDSPMAKTERLLNDLLEEDPYGSITLRQWRIRLAKDWLDRGEPMKAHLALDPQTTSPELPSRSWDQHSQSSSAIDNVNELILEGARTEHVPQRKKALDRALRIADSIPVDILEQADKIRLGHYLASISWLHPDSQGSWRAYSRLFDLCPDPTDPLVTAELASILHRSERDRYLQHQTIGSISNAYAYIDAVYNKLPEGSPAKAMAAHDWLVTTQLYHIAAAVDVDPIPVLDYLDQWVPANHPDRHRVVRSMGNGLSRCHPTDEAGNDRLVGYWEENLAFIKGNQSSRAALAYAYENTAVALGRRARACPTYSRRHLARAIELAHEGLNLVGITADLRVPLVCSFLLNEWAQHEESPDLRSEAIQIQLGALREAHDRQEVDRATRTDGEQKRMYGDLTGLLEMTFHVPRAESKECNEELIWLLSSCLDSDFEDLGKGLSVAASMCRKMLEAEEWGSTSRIAHGALRRVQRTLTAVDNPQEALFYIQGVSSMGAVALAKTGHGMQAAEILERGATLRSRIQLQRHNSPTKDLRVSALPASKRRALSQATSYVTANEIIGLAAQTESPIVYLLASESTGMAVLVTAARIQTIWLPGLTSRKIDTWLDLTAMQQPRSGKTTLRGAGGQGAPSRSAVDTVIGEARADITPLESAIAESGHQSAHIIPLGQTAGIPWTHVLSTPTSIAPSATLLDIAQSREPTTQSVVAITAPFPCHFRGDAKPPMPHAVKESSWLSKHLGCDVTAQGTKATRSAFLRAMHSAPEILHIAVHGEVDAHSWGDEAYLLWADDPSTNEAETTTLYDLSHLRTETDTVFLAACWGGAPNRTLPDESISFPTAFLTAGAKSVIAPLWPIQDDAAHDFVKAFYELWKFDGLTKPEALKQAAQEIRQRPKYRETSTWAAFMLTGSP